MSTNGQYPKVQVIIVTYNSAADILPCLKSIRSNTATLSFIVVDNCSRDDTVALLKEHYPTVQLSAQDKNLGFARAVNLAAAPETADYLLLVNPDTILHEGAIDALVALAGARPSAGLYGGRMLTSDGTLDPTSCLAAPTLAHAAAFGLGLSMFHGWPLLDPDALSGWQRTGTRSVPALAGGLLLAQSSLWTALGGFDEKYFLYGEDVDLCLRAIAHGAHPVFTDRCCYTHHKGSSSSDRTNYTIALLTGKATLYANHASMPALARQLMIVGVGLRAVLERVFGRRPAHWQQAWRKRAEWSKGWSPLVSDQQACRTK